MTTSTSLPEHRRPRRHRQRQQQQQQQHARHPVSSSSHNSHGWMGVIILTIAAVLRSSLVHSAIVDVIESMETASATSATASSVHKGDSAASSLSSSSPYGMDVSFPVQRPVSANYPWLPHNVNRSIPVPQRHQDEPLQVLGDRRQVYAEHLEKCRLAYPNNPHACDHTEYVRMNLNRRQPSGMKNYTATGFQKVRAPDDVVRLMKDFWRRNHYKGKEETWPTGNTMSNSWESPTYLVSVDDGGLRGSGWKLKERIWAAASATLETWTRQELQPASLYGIRVFGEGAIMLPHVNRLPLVASAIVNIAQDLEEDWPFEVYDHDGRAHNVTLEPGDMLLIEGHSVITGNPFPLVGSMYAILYIHFEPTGHALYQTEAGYYIRDEKASAAGGGAGSDGASKSQEDNNSNGGLPPYIQRNSPEEEAWRKDHPNGWTPPKEVLPHEAHAYASAGEIEKLQAILERAAQEHNGVKEDILQQRDEHGWQVLHQGVASGNVAVVELLVDHGAEVNARTHGGYGETPLRIAEKVHGYMHPVVDYLKQMGALSLGPEL